MCRSMNCKNHLLSCLQFLGSTTEHHRLHETLSNKFKVANVEVSNIVNIIILATPVFIPAVNTAFTSRFYTITSLVYAIIFGLINLLAETKHEGDIQAGLEILTSSTIQLMLIRRYFVRSKCSLNCTLRNNLLNASWPENIGNR